MPRGRVGEVAPSPAAVEDLILELGLRLPQSPNLVMELSELRVQRPLLRSQLHLGTDKVINQLQSRDPYITILDQKLKIFCVL